MRPLDRRLLPHLAPARAPLAGVMAAGVASGVLLVAQAFAVAALVAGLFAGATGQDWRAANTAAVALGAVTIGRALSSWLVDVLAARASAMVTTALRRRILAAALSLGPAALSRRRSGELALLSTRGVAAVDPYLTRYLPALLLAATLPVLTVLAIATQDVWSAVIVVATLPLVPVFAVLIGLTTRDRADRQWRALSALSGHFVDVMRGLPTLVVHRRATAQSASIRAITDGYRRATNDTLKLAFASSAVLELVATLSVALVAVTVGLRLSAGSLDLGTALVVLLLAPEAYWPLRRVGAEFHAAAEGTATFEAVDELLASAPGSREGTTVSGLPDAIRLDSVSVRYPDRPTPALQHLSGRIEPRGLTAVTGPSGSGKSTLLAALMGQLPLARGSITVAGVPLADCDLATWQSQIAWVPQRPWLAAASVRDNVRLARPNATDAEIWAALARVALDDVVVTLPGGLGEVVGEDGAGLSAGERARLALARAVIAERPLVLLDEPTAHLDPFTEQVIAETLQWLAERSAVVVVAHRQAIVDLADHVIAVPAPGGASVARETCPQNDRRRRGLSGSGTATQQPDARGGAGRTGVGLWAGATLGALAAASGVALTATAGWLIARAAEHPPVLMLMVAIVGVRTFGLARPALRYVERLVSHDVALRLLAERRARVYDALVPLTPGRLGRQRGDVLASVVDDVDALVDRHLRVRAPLLTFAIVGVAAVAFSLWVLPTAGVVVAVVLVVGGGLAFTTSRIGVAKAERDFVARRGRVSAFVVQIIQGAADLTMWQATDVTLQRLDRAGTSLAAASTRSQRAVATGRALAVLACGLGMVAVAWVGMSALEDGTVSKPMLALLVLLPLALQEVVSPLADVGALHVRTHAADARLAAIAATPAAVSEPDVPVIHESADPSVVVAAASAGWGVEPAFRNLSVDLGPGARLGVVGPSGSGKSTFAALLLRFLDPTSGAVTVGGVDLRRIRLDDVRRTVGLVDDDPHIFASTLRENLRLARPEATDDELLSALGRALLGPWASSLPRGLDTMFGDGYAHVSGGERARIGLARALLADNPVLVLDEPTAHLDSATARAVTDDLLAAGDGRTLVWITHGTVGLDRMTSVLHLGNSPQPPLGPTRVGHVRDAE